MTTGTTKLVQARQKGVAGYTSISRPGRFGNPYRVGDPHPLTGQPMTLCDVLQFFERYLRDRLKTDEDFRAAFLALRGKTLGCPCPGAKLSAEDVERGIEQCHGHVMVRVLEEIGENAR